MRTILIGLMLVPAFAFCGSAAAADDEPNPFREYKGKEPVPKELKETFAGFVRSAKGGSVAGYLLPHAVDTSLKSRPKGMRDYGQNINEDFLMNGFTSLVRTVRKDGDDCYLIRTDSTAVWFVQNKSGAWKVYRYLDKPIQ